MRARFTAALLIGTGLFAQAPAPKSVAGAIAGFRAESAEIEVKTDGGMLIVKTGPSTVSKKIAPGQTDLTKAETISVTDFAIGDRVLVTFGAPDPAEARRIIVIRATDIANKDSADRADWQRRGSSGVVISKAGNDVSVELRSLSGATKFVVTVGPKTTFKRYAPDSVRFADAKNSALSELSVGDQIRARGEKSADGTKIVADDVVFGTFLSKAGTITGLDMSSHEISMKDLATNKPLTVKFIAESRVRRMPDMAAMKNLLAGRGGAGAPGNPDVAQVLDALPPIKFEDLKVGEIAVVSAVHAAKPDQITAITFLANAETLVQLAMAARGANVNGPAPSLAGLASSISNVAP